MAVSTGNVARLRRQGVHARSDPHAATLAGRQGR